MYKNLIILTIAVIIICGCSKKQQKETLTIYSYSSMGWMNQTIKPLFENKYNCTLIIDTNFTDTGDMLSRSIIEKNKPKADIIIGLTPSTLIKAKKENLLQQYKSPNISRIKDTKLIFDDKYYTTPYDYAAIAVIYDPEKIKDLNSFSDLWREKKKLILIDPRSSSTGVDFLLWTTAIYKESWKDAWKNLKEASLTVTPGWSEAFAKFEAGEAPMMVSYATDPAYSFEYYGTSKYKAFIPEEGGFIQIEGASITNGTKHKKLAENFIDYMLSDEFQDFIPTNQWMFPVLNIELPKSFDYAVKPEKILQPDINTITNIDKYIEEWEKIFY